VIGIDENMQRLEGNDEVTNIVKQLERRMVDSPECPH
jgi:hypothetical protein